jgi:hypothetical protein
MDSFFAGKVTLYSSRDTFQGRAKEVPDISFRGAFADGAATFSVTDFKRVVVPDIDSPVGKLTLTASLTEDGSGELDVATGAMTVKVKFRFEFDHPLVRSSVLRLALTTAQATMPAGDVITGSPLQAATGAFKLVAAGTFKGGALDKDLCGVIVEGTFTPSPI